MSLNHHWFQQDLPKILEKAILIKLKIENGILKIRIMVYEMSHILLGDIRVTQVQDSYLMYKRENLCHWGVNH